MNVIQAIQQAREEGKEFIYRKIMSECGDDDLMVKVSDLNVPFEFVNVRDTGHVLVEVRDILADDWSVAK